MKRTRKNGEMNEQTIQRALYSIYNNYDYKLFNIYVFGMEVDFFAMSKSGYAIEIEIKISKADFKKDFEKKDKHGRYADKSFSLKPNRFMYACPYGLIDVSEVPEYAGLIYIGTHDYNSTIIKEPPLLHKKKHMENINFVKALLNKYRYRYYDILRKYEIKNWDVNDRQLNLFNRDSLW